ncbi:MAG TPA: acetylxylan esterase [Pedobacter sp.]|uniref:alpha/beta hydrolase family protein n=1 Tax=Pedobacter sp. TaxID=1411316 RepID=UPI002CF66656|nr:acetylxylan esterase [Pedobacter sp.]HMI05218.1 acetylxylan esterase [Pedobacter sp.]
MKILILFPLLLSMTYINSSLPGQFSDNASPSDLHDTNSVISDSLPSVLAGNHADLIESKLRNEAVCKFGSHQLPDDLKEWEKYRIQLRNTIIQKTGLIINHKLPLDMKETGSITMDGYTIKNIAFQTRPNVYATANLYIPEGKGPFPAVITMHGHWPGGRLYESFQAISQTLALNGYVCLNIDAAGAGERTTTHGQDEYHGANLGASLMNIGETLAGVQISDNMRGVDLLTSLPYVDPKKIGATGASGGGNQTMWLAALDERIKAAMPVVSVGTFESYIMRSNCVCELMPDGLTFTEESGVIALVAPRAIKLCNNIVDNPTFLSSEMLRTFNNARPIFKLLNVENNLSNLVSNKTHGYWPETREVLLGWLDLHLKGIGTGEPKKEIPFKILPNEKLLVYPNGSRDPKVETIAAYAKRRGQDLRSAYLDTKSFDVNQKKKALRSILRTNEKSELKKIHTYTSLDGWDRLCLETSDGKLIPLLHSGPSNHSMGYMVICDPQGKNNISASLLDKLKKKGLGIIIVDLSGTGEASSSKESTGNKSMVLHTLSRSELWLGKTILGEWVKELGLVSDFLRSKYKAAKIGIDGSREAGLAGMFLSATEGKIDYLVMREAPLSYAFDNRANVDFFSMGIHLPDFLNWGDVSLAAALSGKQIEIINPVTMSGRRITGDSLSEYQKEFEKIRSISKQPGKTVFN